MYVYIFSHICINFCVCVYEYICIYIVIYMYIYNKYAYISFQHMFARSFAVLKPKPATRDQMGIMWQMTRTRDIMHA